MGTAIDATEHLREAVRRAYSEAALHPGDTHSFPVGRHFAESIGYPHDLLSSMPPESVDAFTGVSNVSLFAEISTGASVLDLGCGAGLDALIAAGRTGPAGRVIGIDFSESMLSRAHQAAAEFRACNVELLRASAEQLPIGDEVIDVAMINGIFNLNPEREAIFRELARVLRQGGSVYAAELILREPLPSAVRDNPDSWFS